MNMVDVQLIVGGWMVASLLMMVAWLLQRILDNAAVVDVMWCLGFVVVAIGYAVGTSGDPTRRLLIALMVAVWGMRLGHYLLFNRVIGKQEEARYQTLRGRWGNRAQLYYFLIFQVEALGFPVFSLPLLVLMQNDQPTFSLWEWVGILVWLVSITGEWLADRQLSRFRADPQNRGKTLRRGLWRYSRHPNYFFESLHWWAYVFMSIGLQYWWVTFLAPVTMTIFLLKISGIPLAEAQALAGRGEEYREYQRTTNAFIPWFPKEEKR